MKMALCTLIGVAALAALVLFFAPARSRVEGVMFEKTGHGQDRPGPEQAGPLTEAADKAEGALQNAWDGACGTVRKTLKKDAPSRPDSGSLDPDGAPLHRLPTCRLV